MTRDENLWQRIFMKETSADRLKKARINAGFFTKADAARAAGVKPSTFNAHENGQNQITPEAARLYGATFNVDPSWLMALDVKGGVNPPAMGGTKRDSERFQFAVKPPIEIWRAAIQAALEHEGIEPAKAALITEVVLSVAYAQLPAGLGLTEAELARQLVLTGLTKQNL